MNKEDIFEVRPSRRQVEWQRLEFYGFIHFGINTMTGREWGVGHEDLSLFNPVKLDAEQWVAICKSAGMKALILTCKHHDGFCLWPSRYSDHTVANTPWKQGQGDVVREVADACQRQGLKFGVYLSPWDRTEASYGEGKLYDDFYVHQLTELLTNYGEIACVWLDGANGEGPSGKKQYYDWDRYYETIRRLQPECVISVCGPDIRWVGNEAGHTRQEEWSVVPKFLRDAEKVAEKSQQADDGEFSRSLNSMDEDLGSRRAIAKYSSEEWAWYPAEVNTSIRPGWFYHPEEDRQVRSSSELFDIYLNAVGGNATFLLNIPPNPQGIIVEEDRRALADLGSKIARLNDTNLGSGAQIEVSSHKDDAQEGVEDLQNLLDSHSEFAWRPAENDTEPWVQLALENETTIDTIMLQEQIQLGQRVEQFEVWASGGELVEWSLLAEGSIIGYKKTLSLPETRLNQIRIVFKQYRGYPTLNHVRLLHLGEKRHSSLTQG